MGKVGDVHAAGRRGHAAALVSGGTSGKGGGLQVLAVRAADNPGMTAPRFAPVPPAPRAATRYLGGRRARAFSSGLVAEVWAANGALHESWQAEIDDLGLTPTEAFVLRRVVAAEEPTATQLAAEMRCSRIDVKRRLARLVAQDLLAFGAPRPPDGRMEIAVSERGRWVAKELDRRETAWMRRLLRGFSGAELEMLEALLARLATRANGASSARARRGA